MLIMTRLHINVQLGINKVCPSSICLIAQHLVMTFYTKDLSTVNLLNVFVASSYL